VFTEVTLSDHRREDFARFEAAIREVDEVLECHLVSGGYDYLLRFLTRGVNHYQEVIEELLDAQHRHRKILQLHRHQVAVHQDALPGGEAVSPPALMALEAAGLAFPDAAVVVARAREFDVDAAQAAGRLGQWTRGPALVFQAGEGGGLVKNDDAHGQAPASTASASSASVWKW
jgi:hypothetical protein